jgi:hypothetical protein
VEIASHSFNLHHGILGNPQGNSQPAATTRSFNQSKNRYSSDRRYQQRITNDLKRNSDLIARHTGKQPRVMVWPYGEYSHEAINISHDIGMPFTMTLRDGINKLNDSREIRRVLIEANPKLEDFIYALEHINETDPVRAVRVAMDTIYDADPKKANANLGRLLDRIKALEINTVYLQAVADTDADGLADSAYFPNRHLPVVADFLNRVEWQLGTRVGLSVYAWMPFHSFALPNKKKINDVIINEIYGDMAKSSHIDGILFYDIEHTAKSIENSYSQLKSLESQVRYYRPEIKTALALSSTTDLNTLPSITDCCDYLLLDFPMPVADNQQENLITSLSKKNFLTKKIVVELSLDENTNHLLLGKNQIQQTYLNLMQEKAIQLSYYPFTPTIATPVVDILKSTLSLRSHPFGP